MSGFVLLAHDAKTGRSYASRPWTGSVVADGLGAALDQLFKYIDLAQLESEAFVFEVLQQQPVTGCYVPHHEFGYEQAAELYGNWLIAGVRA